MFIFCCIFLYLWLYFVLLVIFCAFANSTGGDSSVGRSSALRLKDAELAMCRCVLGKDALSLFLNQAEQSTVVVTQPDERLANETKSGCSALVWFDRHRMFRSYGRMSQKPVLIYGGKFFFRVNL